MMLTAEGCRDLKENETLNQSAEVIYLFDDENGESWQQETDRLYEAILPLSREPSLVVPVDIPVKLRRQEVLVEICEFPDYFIRRGAEQPSAEDIRQQLQALPWNETTFVTLRLNRNNWMEASGSEAAGYSVLCCVDGSEYVTHSAPPSLDVVIRLLQSYAARDGAWRSAVGWCD